MPTIMMKKPFKDLKGDERRYCIEDAARILKEYAKVRKDKALLTAAREKLKMEIEERQAAIKS